MLLLRAGSLGAAVARLLQETPLRVTPRPVGTPPRLDGAFDLVVLAADRPFFAVADAIDARCWETGTSWIPAWTLAHCHQVGPAVIPGVTPCFDCWRRRVRSQALEPELFDAIAVHAAQPAPERWFAGELGPIVLEAAAILAADCVSLARGDYRPPGRRLGQYWAGDAVFGALTSHRFAAIGPCRRCGARDERRHGAPASPRPERLP